MIEIICEYVVQEETRGRFELTYGPGGAWSRLFAGCAGFRGITVLRDTQDARRYLTIEVWDTEAQTAQARLARAAELTGLESALAELSAFQTRLGSFSLLAAATVRPLGKSGRGSPRDDRRTGRQDGGLGGCVERKKLSDEQDRTLSSGFARPRRLGSVSTG